MIQLYPVDFVLVISLFQCLFLSVIILQKYRSLLANKTLSLLFLTYALVMIEMVLWDMNYHLIYPHFVLILTGAPFLIGPFHYLYTTYLSHYAKEFKTKHLLHFIPFVIYELSILPLIFQSKESLVARIKYTESGGISVISLILNWLIILHIVSYTIFVALVIRKYSKRIKNIFSSVENIKLGWLRNTAILFSAGIVMYIIENALNTSGIISSQFVISSLITPVVIYMMGYLAIIKSEIFASPEFNRLIEEIPVEEPEVQVEDIQSVPKKYIKSGLSEEKAKEYVTRLINVMENDKPYLNSELTLSKLAELISIPPHNLSEVINTQLNQSFFDFINSYRVNKVKYDLSDPAKNNLTLLGIAMDAGFNSKSSFNTIFKKHTGLTPSGYKKSLAE